MIRSEIHLLAPAKANFHSVLFDEVQPRLTKGLIVNTGSRTDGRCFHIRSCSFNSSTTSKTEAGHLKSWCRGKERNSEQIWAPQWQHCAADWCTNKCERPELGMRTWTVNSETEILLVDSFAMRIQESFSRLTKWGISVSSVTRIRYGRADFYYQQVQYLSLHHFFCRGCHCPAGSYEGDLSFPCRIYGAGPSSATRLHCTVLS